MPCLTFLIFTQSLKLRPKTKSRSLKTLTADAISSAQNREPMSTLNHLINTARKHSRYLALSTVKMKSCSQLLSTTTSWTIAPSTFCRELIHDVYLREDLSWEEPLLLRHWNAHSATVSLFKAKSVITVKATSAAHASSSGKPPTQPRSTQHLASALTTLPSSSSTSSSKSIWTKLGSSATIRNVRTN